MIYESTGLKLEDMAAAFGGNEKNTFRMAKVMLIDKGKPIIRFHGETENAKKQYKRLASYSPAAGDYIMLAKMAKTYVILGKVVE